MSLSPAKGSLLLLLLMVPAWSVCAQSGRRAPKPQPSPQPATVPKEDDAETLGRNSTSAESVQKVKLLVARQRTSKQFISEDTIFARFLQRLNEFTGVSGSSLGELKREDAIKRARNEAESFVVLLQFEIDNFQGGRIVLNSPDLEVKYFVYAPRTGELKTKGKIYYQAISGAGARKANWPKGPPIKITAEATGIEAADRLHDWLTIVLGSRRDR